MAGVLVLSSRGGVLSNKEVGHHTKFRGKIWGKVRPSSPNKRKNLGRSVTTRRKSWEKVPILGSYLKLRGQNLGYLSLKFLEVKFGAPTRVSEANFGVKRPDLPIWKCPSWVYLQGLKFQFLVSLRGCFCLKFETYYGIF